VECAAIQIRLPLATALYKPWLAHACKFGLAPQSARTGLAAAGFAWTVSLPAGAASTIGMRDRFQRATASDFGGIHIRSVRSQTRRMDLCARFDTCSRGAIAHNLGHIGESPQTCLMDNERRQAVRALVDTIHDRFCFRRTPNNHATITAHDTGIETEMGRLQ